MEAGYDESIYRNLETIAAHERAYVDFFTDVVVSRNLTPATEDVYMFPNRDPKSLLELLTGLKRIGVAVYVFIPSFYSNLNFSHPGWLQLEIMIFDGMI